MALQRLDIYQMALRHLGDLRLATLTDDVEARYALDDAWLSAPTFVLRQAAWRFALKTANPSVGGSVINGYTTSYAFPDDWLRTHALYAVNSVSPGRECPFDFREQGAAFSVNPVNGTLCIRYVSSLFADPAFANWPEQFAECVAAYLAFLVAEKVTGDPRQASRMSELFSQLLDTAARIDAIPEDPWLPFQRDGSFLRVARTMIDQGFWRFAMKTTKMTTGPSGVIGGLSQQVAIPADWSRTRSLFVLTADGLQRRPFDVREQAGAWYTNATTFYAEYLSSTLAMEPTEWPDHYMRAVLRELEYDRIARQDNADKPPTYGRDAPQRADTAWHEALADTLDSEALAPDPWLPYQLDGSFVRGAQSVIARGYWWFALKTVDFDSKMQETTRADNAFPYRYKLPDDWLKTHSLYISYGGTECPFDIRESASHWSTDRPFFTARYVSTRALDPTLWPEPVAQAVLAYLDWRNEPEGDAKDKKANAEQAEALEFQALLASALDSYSLAEDPWLRFQIDGRYNQAVRLNLEKGRWRFATRTVVLTDPNNSGTTTTTPIAGDPTAVSDGSVSPGFACRMLIPNDCLRILRVTFSMAQGGIAADWLDGGYRDLDIEYRDELDAIHTNYNPIRFHYVSRLGFDATRWPSNFRDAVLSWLEYMEARADPKMAAVAKERLAFFQMQCAEAERLDDEREMPRLNNVGQFVRGRYRHRFAPAGASGAGVILTNTTNPQTGATPTTGDSLTLGGQTLTLDGETLTLP